MLCNLGWESKESLNILFYTDYIFLNTYNILLLYTQKICDIILIYYHNIVIQQFTLLISSLLYFNSVFFYFQAKKLKWD